MYTLENKYLKVSVNGKGACLDSIIDKNNGKELLWQGDSKSWEDKDLCLFPFVGRLVNGDYQVDGTTYNMRIHGFAPYMEFLLVSLTAESIVLELESNIDTLKEYPYLFSLIVSIKLSNNKIAVNYKIKNTDKKKIYFGIGGHPGFVLDNSNGEDYLTFGEDVERELITLNDSCQFIVGSKSVGKVEKLIIEKSLFSSDALIFKNNAKTLSLVKLDGTKVVVDIEQANYVGVWSHPTHGDYVCVEPWWSLPDYFEVNKELSKKPTLQNLDINEAKDYTYNIIIEKI